MLFLAYAAFLALLAISCHAHISPFEELIISYEGSPGGLKEMHSLFRAGTKDWKQDKAFATIKFMIPPSETEDFEKAWLKLQSDVDQKEGDKAPIFDLKKVKLTNVMYWSYGEWTTMEDLHNHLESDHFMNFAKQADSIGAKWEFKWLEQVDEKAKDKKRGREEGADQKEQASVVHLWVVPPEEKTSFVKAWKKAADMTAKEEGNKIMSLSKAVSNNFIWFSYGCWDNMESYLSHMESKHHMELKKWAAGADAVWTVVPLEKIGNQRE